MTDRRLESRMARVILGATAVVLTFAACNSGTSPSHGTVQSVVISPDSIGLTIGTSNTLTAVAQDAAAHAVSGASFFWSTSDSLVATVTQSGAVTAHQAGAAQIGASTQGKTGFAKVVVAAALVHSVTVSPAHDTIFASAPSNSVTLSATTFDAQGQILTGRPVTWSAASNLVTVTNGVVTATDVAAGTAVVTAASSDPGNPSASASVVVIGHVATVTLSPASPLISVSGIFANTTVQMTANLVDTFGTDVTGQRTVTWSSDNAAIASVGQNTGLVTAQSDMGSGKATITATTSDGLTGNTTVTVLP